MRKKNETILIRVDSEIKESFRKLCESKDITMTDMISEQINKMLLNFETINETSNISTVVKEKNFYREELEVYKEVFSSISSQLQKLDRNNIHKQRNIYFELLVNNFSRVKQFAGYEIDQNYIRLSQSKLIATNSETNKKLLIDFRSGSLYNFLISPRGRSYKELCDRFKLEAEIELVIINLDPAQENIEEQVKKLSKKIGYNIIVYDINELLNFLYVNEV